MPFNTEAKNSALNALDEVAALPAVFITHVGVHTLTDPGTGTNASGTEALGGTPAYARQAITWATAAGGTKSNSGALTFDVPAGTYGFFTLWNVGTTGNVGNYRGYIPFGGSATLKGFFSLDTTTSDALLSRAHGMANGDRVMLFNVFSEALPAGLVEGTIYHVVESTADSFKVSTTAGGIAVDITTIADGEGYWQRVVPEVFGAQGQITVAAGALVLDATSI